MLEEVTHESWFSRLGGAFKGIVTGILVFVAAFPLLWWNEGRAVKTAKALTEGAAAVAETASNSADPADDGKFVHVTGEASTEEMLEDPDFGVAVNAIRLERKSEMYQWKEDVESTTRKKLGGGTETVKKYTYRKTWSDRAIDSSDFREGGHENPGEFPFAGLVKSARDVRLDAYQLPDSLIGKIRKSEALPVSLEDVPADWRTVVRPYGSSGFYLPANGAQRQSNTATPTGQPAETQHATTQATSGQPQIGDVRISYTVTRPTTVSVMAQQSGSTFTPFKTSNGRALNMLAMGNVPADEMISRAEAENTAWTWGLRIGGFVMMGIGLGMVFRPLSVLADVLPIAGDFVEAGTGMISFFIAGACSLTTISVAWLFYRPLIGVPLFVAGIGLVGALVHFVRKARSSRVMTSSIGSTVSNLAVENTASSNSANQDVAVDDLDEAISV